MGVWWVVEGEGGRGEGVWWVRERVWVVEGEGERRLEGRIVDFTV